MGLMLNSLLTACTMASHTPQDTLACQKATQAGATQLGVLQEIDGMEDHTVKFLEQKAEKNVGKDGVYAVGGTYFVVRTIQTKSVNFGLPNFSIADSIKVELGENQSLIRFEWKF